MSVLNKIINAIIFVLIGFGALFLALFAIGIRPYVVLSGSMEPEIGVGSIVFVNQNAKFDELKADDVISFRKADLMVTHRVFKIEDDKIVTKGDANEVEDGGYVTADMLIGKDVFVLPKLGFIVEFIQSTQGKIISGIVVLALIIASLATGRDNDKKKQPARVEIETQDEPESDE